MNVAIIPARGGSKRIPRKNIKEFCGKPMIAWSIEAAIESGCFSRVIVSTDDDEIAGVARQFGAEAPFKRPTHLADDHTPTIPVVSHAIEWLEAHGDSPEYACCIYATAPFVEAEVLRAGFFEISGADEDYTVSVTTFDYPVQRALRITADNRIEMMQPEHMDSRSQDLETAWHDAGQFYWGRARAWRDMKPIFRNAARPVPLERIRVQDIDTPEDWRRAESMFQALARSAS